MRIVPKMFGVLGLAAALGACGSTPTVYNTRIYHDEWPIFFSGSSQSEFLAIVWGNPFDADKAQTNAVVLDSVDQAFNRAEYSFSTNPPAVDPLVPYVSVLFNPGSVASGLPCADLTQLQPTPSAAGEVRVHAALCRGGTPLTGARGYIEQVTGPNDPRFEDLMYQIAVELFRYQPGTDTDQRFRS